MKNNSLKELCQKTWELCSSLLELIDELQLLPVKPRAAFLTDAGPGVGVSNFEVKFRDAKLARMYNSDYQIRLHGSRGDSGQGEAEQSEQIQRLLTQLLMGLLLTGRSLNVIRE